MLLKVIEDNHHNRPDIWDNFLNSLPSGCTSSELYHVIDKELTKYGAKDQDGSPYIEFEKEEDATFFMLRFV